MQQSNFARMARTGKFSRTFGQRPLRWALLSLWAKNSQANTFCYSGASVAAATIRNYDVGIILKWKQ